MSVVGGQSKKKKKRKSQLQSNKSHRTHSLVIVNYSRDLNVRSRETYLEQPQSCHFFLRLSSLSASS